MLSFFRKLFGKSHREAPDVQFERVRDSRHTVRRWESAESTRLNEAHWAHATGQAINTDLAADLPTLQARCHYEFHNNPLVEGVVRTHSLDLVGPTGPTLQVVSDDERFNKRLEQVWAWWFARPDATGQHTGLSWLIQQNIAMWLDGPILTQLISDPSASKDDPVVMRLNDIAPSRLETPLQYAGDRQVTLGVRRNEHGRPTQLYISDYDPNHQVNLSLKHTPLPPDDVIHEYEIVEPGQVTGYPRLASSLQDIADIRDFDLQELDILRAAAETGVYFVTTEPEAMRDFSVQSTTNSHTLPRRTHRYLEPGYKPFQLTPGQPTSEAMHFRLEKIRGIGRPVHMPLLLILLSAEKSNFSQSRIDVHVFYERGLRVLRRWLEQRVLNRLVNEVLREAQLSGVIPRRRGTGGDLRRLANAGHSHMPPFGVHYEWGWDPLPQANPRDHAMGLQIRRQLGLDTLGQQLSAEGRDYLTQMDALAQEDRDRIGRGLAPFTRQNADLNREPTSETSPENDDSGSSRAARTNRALHVAAS